MRFLSRLLLGAALAGAVLATAHAESATVEAKPAKKPRAKAPPYRLIRVLPETGQALLLDKKRGKHVVVDVGESVGGYEVTEIAEDSVVLARPGDAREYVLVAGEAPTSRLADPYPIPDPAPVDPASPLIDPYPAGVLDPYGSEGTREVQAPEGQRASEQPPEPPKETPASDKPAEKAKEAPPPEPPPPTSFTVKRTVLDDALGDFSAIEKAVDMALVDDKVELRRVEPGSFFHTMGLRAGDRVKKVHGTVIRSLDDAAAVYARLAKAKKFTVELERGGEPLTLTYKITK